MCDNDYQVIMHAWSHIFYFIFPKAFHGRPGIDFSVYCLCNLFPYTNVCLFWTNCSRCSWGFLPVMMETDGKAQFILWKIAATSDATGETPSHAVASCLNGSSQKLRLAQLSRQLALWYAMRHALRQGKPGSQAGRWLIMHVSHWTCDKIV